MRLFHTTTAEAAASIATDGFQDREGSYLTTTTWRGVWLADRPLDANEGAVGEDVFVLEGPEDVVAEYEWIEDGKPYREFLVPAEIVNTFELVRRTDLYELRDAGTL